VSKRTRLKSPLVVTCTPNPLVAFDRARGVTPKGPRQFCKWVCRTGARIRAAEFVGRRDWNRGWTAVLHPSTKEPGRWQLSLFDKDGAFGDSIRDTCAAALDARDIIPDHWKLKAVE